MDMEIGNPHLAWLLIFIPLLLTLSIYNRWARRRALVHFGSKPNGVVGGLFSAILLAAGIGLLVLACMDIRWGKTTRAVPQKGLEVVFALDVSRSMLAEDAKPNRLVRAKQQIKDMVGEMAGDRIGLVAFAGEAVQSVPLTNHYDDFRQKLDEVGPHSVSKGGSQLGVAIRSAADSFISKTNEHRTIVLSTDGEDQESQPLELAKALHTENGLRIFTVGLGDIAQGARIPDDNVRSKQYVEHEGQQVWSKLNGSILSAIATETKAAYIPAGTKRVNMADVYHNYIAAVEKSEFETAKINAYVPRFQWFAFPAFVCLILNVWMSARKTKRDGQAGKKEIFSQSPKTVTTKRASMARPSKVAAVALALMPASVFAQSSGQASDQQAIASKINAANELVRNNESEKAIAAFSQIVVSDDSSFRDELNYNLASAHYHNSDLEAAKTLLEETARSSNTSIASDSRYNLGNCHYAQALLAAEQRPETAIDELEQAIAHYRSSLRLNRQRSDARENIERARKLIEQLKNPQKDEKQDQKSEDQKKENQEKDQQQNPDDQQKKNQSQQDQNQDQKQKESSDSNDGGKDQPSEPQSQDTNESQDTKESQEQSESQSAKGEQGDNEQANPDSGNTSEDNSDSDSQDSQSQNTESQSTESKNAKNDSAENSNSTSDNVGKDQQSENAKSNEPQGAKSQSANRNSSAEIGREPETDQTASDQQPGEGKEPPKGNVTAANEQKDSDATLSGSANMATKEEQDSSMMSRQEALKLLQAVRDRDMLRRLRQQRQQRQRRIKVDKDW